MLFLSYSIHIFEKKTTIMVQLFEGCEAVVRTAVPLIRRCTADADIRHRIHCYLYNAVLGRGA